MLIFISTPFRIWNTGIYALVFEYYGNIVVSLLFIHSFNLKLLKYPLYNNLCRKVFVEYVKKDLFTWAGLFFSLLTIVVLIKEIANRKQCLQWISWILKCYILWRVFSLSTYLFWFYYWEGSTYVYNLIDNDTGLAYFQDITFCFCDWPFKKP